MRVYLYFFEFNLGYLEQEENMYVWKPDVSVINKARKKYPDPMDFLFLPDIEKAYEKIPNHFNEFYIASSRPDLKENAKILDSDTPMEKLYKMSKLNYFNEEFVIKDK